MTYNENLTTDKNGNNKDSFNERVEEESYERDKNIKGMISFNETGGPNNFGISNSNLKTSDFEYKNN